jgi:hypothetical protein
VTEDFRMHLIKESSKFDYSFTTLIFATLALSIQFSPSMGMNIPWLLIVSWLFYFIAAVAGGNLILRKQVFYRNNYNQLMATTEEDELEAAQIEDRERKKVSFLYILRLWAFLIGVFLNFVFVSVNYLVKANAIHFCSCGIFF